VLFLIAVVVLAVVSDWENSGTPAVFLILVGPLWICAFVFALATMWQFGRFRRGLVAAGSAMLAFPAASAAAATANSRLTVPGSDAMWFWAAAIAATAAVGYLAYRLAR
jgi:hypothetical protein